MIGYALVGIISAVGTYLITRFHQKVEIARAYDRGFNEARDTAIFPAIKQEVQEERYSQLYRTEPTYSAEPVFTRPSETSIAIQQEIDQLCQDMDSDTEMFLAHLEADSHRTMAYAGRDFRDRDMTGPIP